MKAYDILKQAARTYRAKNRVYGDSYVRHGHVMAALFPNGLTLRTAEDFGRFAILDLIMVKLIRYTKDFQAKHQDSIHDATVYASILEEIDEEGIGDGRGQRARGNLGAPYGARKTSGKIHLPISDEKRHKARHRKRN